MRGLLVVNPRATTTSPLVTDVIVHALADEIDLDVVFTTYRGHAHELGLRARREGLDVVVTLGGDGTVNETVNGMLDGGPGDDVPMLATVPGGSANVFARALGLPVDPVEATGQLLDAIRSRRSREIGLGSVNGRLFLANAGLGMDAEVIASMEAKRAAGHSASPLRYLTTTLAEFFVRTDRRTPALTLTRPGLEPVGGVFLLIVQNASPWTYFGSVSINPCPRAAFEAGLDAFGVRRMGIGSALLVARRMLARSGAGSSRLVEAWHDQSEFTVTAARPVRLQVDGEGLEEVTEARFRSVPRALRALV